MNSAAVVQKLWNYCNVLRDDGMSYGDYVEQLTYLLFLKMTDERSKPPFNQPTSIPKGYDWNSLLKLEGDELFDHYRHTLEKLGSEKGLLGLIFAKAQNKFQDPVKLRRLIVDLLESEQWSVLDVDVKGEAYEGLLEKNAQDTKSGAGQYFTPRPLIRAIVECISPQKGETICDPACGTGGFLLAAHEYIRKHSPQLSLAERKHLDSSALSGWELVQGTARLAAMNMILHGVGTDGSLPIRVSDALVKDPLVRFDVVLANPPFGKKSSAIIAAPEGKAAGEKELITRSDFWVTTSNKQLNFIQHIKTLLGDHGRAAVVIPDNVLFEGGAGEVIRRRLLEEFDVHTLLRLPTGLFYAQGVKANVIFFTRKDDHIHNSKKVLWIYDLRTSQRFTLKTNPLKIDDLKEFVSLYREPKRKETWSVNVNAEANSGPSGRWRAYSYSDLIRRDKCNWDIFWLRDSSVDDGELEAPDLIAQEILNDLEAALFQFKLIYGDFEASVDDIV